MSVPAVAVPSVAAATNSSSIASGHEPDITVDEIKGFSLDGLAVYEVRPIYRVVHNYNRLWRIGLKETRETALAQLNESFGCNSINDNDNGTAADSNKKKRKIQQPAKEGARKSRRLQNLNPEVLNGLEDGFNKLFKERLTENNEDDNIPIFGDARLYSMGVSTGLP